jgi:hypothetical protein
LLNRPRHTQGRRVNRRRRIIIKIKIIIRILIRIRIITRTIIRIRIRIIIPVSL